MNYGVRAGILYAPRSVSGRPFTAPVGRRGPSQVGLVNPDSKQPLKGNRVKLTRRRTFEFERRQWAPPSTSRIAMEQNNPIATPRTPGRSHRGSKRTPVGGRAEIVLVGPATGADTLDDSCGCDSSQTGNQA